MCERETVRQSERECERVRGRASRVRVRARVNARPKAVNLCVRHLFNRQVSKLLNKPIIAYARTRHPEPNLFGESKRELFGGLANQGSLRVFQHI